MAQRLKRDGDPSDRYNTYNAAGELTSTGYLIVRLSAMRGSIPRNGTVEYVIDQTFTNTAERAAFADRNGAGPRDIDNMLLGVTP